MPVCMFQISNSMLLPLHSLHDRSKTGKASASPENTHEKKITHSLKVIEYESTSTSEVDQRRVVFQRNSNSNSRAKPLEANLGMK